jgi:hypothetical protein
VDQVVQISLAAQATAVRRAAVNLKGHVDNLRRLVALRQRREDELEVAQSWLPALTAAADTVEALAGKSEAAS